MNKIWVISDTHFGHDKMVQYCGRPENHSDLILLNLNFLTVGDILIHLGDICIGDDKEWNLKLRLLTQGCKKILCRGNHDKKSDSWYISNGWDFVCHSFNWVYNKRLITFSHLPQNIKNLNIHGHYHNALNRLLKKDFVVDGEEERNKKDFDLKYYDKNIHKLVSLENLNYKPILLDNLIK